MKSSIFSALTKRLEGIEIETLDWAGVQEAFVEVEASAKRYQAHAAGMG